MDLKWSSVVDLFQEELEEYQTINAIKSYLLTKEQDHLIRINHLSIEDMLNGRFTSDKSELVMSILNQWNQVLGWNKFGF